MSSDVTRLLLVRHAESEWNAEGRWQGHGDSPLSRAGREHASHAARTLRGFTGAVVSSDLRRAVETAEIIAAELGGLDVRVEPDLREIDVGEFSGLTGAEVEELFPDETRLRAEGRLDRFPGGESRKAFLERVLAAVERLVEGPSEEFLVVTHGGVIRALEHHLDLPREPLPNLAGRWFRWDDGLEADADRFELA